jgi:hypothetical protein
MGARTNFTFTTDTGDLTLYSHWGGDSKVTDLAYALNKAMPRIKMGDTGYALRITVSNLIGPEWESETGYGLFVGKEGGEEQYEPITVDFTTNTIIDSSGKHSIEDFVSYHGAAPALI